MSKIVAFGTRAARLPVNLPHWTKEAFRRSRGRALAPVSPEVAAWIAAEGEKLRRGREWRRLWSAWLETKRKRSGLVSAAKTHRDMLNAIHSGEGAAPFSALGFSDERFCPEGTRGGDAWTWRAHATVYPAGVIVKQTGAPGRSKISGGGERGEISTFSVKSQTRLRRRLISLDWLGLAGEGKKGAFGRGLFVTLTYPDIFPHIFGEDGALEFDRGAVKRHLDTLGKRLKRLKKFEGFLWKMEVEPRKSGTMEGHAAPHFHCILTFRKSVQVIAIRRLIAAAWSQIAGGGDEKHRRIGTRVDRINRAAGLGRLMSYLVKYLTKDEFKPGQILGRIWSEIGEIKRAVPVNMTTGDYYFFRVFVDRIRGYTGRKIKRLEQFGHFLNSFTVYGTGEKIRELFEGIYWADHDEIRMQFKRDAARGVA